MPALPDWPDRDVQTRFSPAAIPQPAPPPDTGPTVQWPTPRRSRRALLAGVLLGLTGLSVAGAVIVSTCTLCYAVSTDGSPPLAYVQGEDTYQTAVRQVEDQVSEILRSDYRYAQETTMALTIAPKNSLQTSDQLTASLMETVDQVKAEYILTIDGLPIGACESREAIDQAVRLREGQFKEVGEELLAEMEQAAEELRFEKAAELRDRFKAIELLGKRQKVVAGSLADTDVVGFHKGEATRSCFVVLHYVEGELAAKDWELIETPMEEDRADILSALVGQYYGGRGRLPRQILLPCELEDAVPLMRLLSEQAGHRVELVTPQRGAKMDLIRLANKNAVEEVERWTTREERQSKLMELLGRMLDLDAPPRRIESYDISNQGADDIVASMVVYVNAKPLKRDYRRFKLKDMDGPDDYASMEQVLTRRFQRYLDGDEKFSDKPDLLLIDGGVNHANVAVRVLESLGLRIPIFGMVKDDRHRTRALVTPEGKEIGIQGNQAIFSLIGQIQEETHRFAIEFHRQQQNQRVRGSVLDQIPGVGEKRRAELLKAFKSIKNIKSATLAELEDAVPKNTARAVYDFFHQKGEEPSCE